jgi:hypothetical protein
MNSREYQSSILLNFINKREKKIYHYAAWLSHTNEDRMRLFLDDISPIRPANLRIMPNYPPKEWGKAALKQRVPSPMKVIYVGALNFVSMYLSECIRWIESKRGEFTLDVYSLQDTSEVNAFIREKGISHVKVKGFVAYGDLPGILSDYHIGIILYKGHNENFVFNAPNKLFEYLACGLDVWFPVEMKGVHPYINRGNPLVLPIDFRVPTSLDDASRCRRVGESDKRLSFASDQVLGPLRSRLLG